MAKVRPTEDHIKKAKFVLNLESVGLRLEQFFRLCGDNPELRSGIARLKQNVFA